jgi:uncharacterized membrane protein (UPF0136 family)
MSPPTGSSHLNFSLGGLVMVGGAIGYAKKGSIPSLVAGLTFGGLLIGSGVLINKGESFQGHALASGVTGLMTIAMAQRFMSSGKFMPSGAVAALGAVGLAYNLKKAIEWMPESTSKSVCSVCDLVFFFMMMMMMTTTRHEREKESMRTICREMKTSPRI